MPLQHLMMKSFIASYNSKLHNTIFYKLFDSKLESLFNEHKTRYYAMNYKEGFRLGDKYFGLFIWKYDIDTWTESSRILIKQKNSPSYFEEKLDITDNNHNTTLYKIYRTDNAIIQASYNVNELPKDIFTLKKLKNN